MSTHIVLKALTRWSLKFISCRATDILFGYKHRFWWTAKGQTIYKRYYHNEYKTRAPIVEELRSLLIAEEINFAKIIEFG
jgi:hypothetical protein